MGPGPTPAAGTELIRRKMQAQRSRDTAPEVRLRRELHARGARFRLSGKLPISRRTADLVWVTRKVAVFVDGCFWHGCPEHFVLPKTNSDWWREKIDRNRVRDAETNAALAAQGWTVLRFWEHADMAEAAGSVLQVLKRGPS